MWIAFMTEPRVYFVIVFWLLVFFLREQEWFWVFVKETVPAWLRTTSEYLSAPVVKTGILAALSVHGTKYFIQTLEAFSKRGGVMSFAEKLSIEVIALFFTFVIVGLFSYHLYRQMDSLTLRSRESYVRWYEKKTVSYEKQREREEKEERNDLNLFLQKQRRKLYEKKSS